MQRAEQVISWEVKTVKEITIPGTVKMVSLPACFEFRYKISNVYISARHCR